MPSLRLGTRASPLARWQANWVAAALAARGVAVDLVLLATQGDAQQQPPLASLGPTPGLFTKELQRALLDGRIDLAVHSLKDLPTDPIPGVALAAVPLRHDPRDVLLARGPQSLGELPPGAVVGTGSWRRRAQLLHHRPDLQVQDVRGNVDSRVRKLQAGHYDALLLALAGLERLGLAAQVSQVLPVEIIMPAVGQGALGIEIRSDDQTTRSLVEPLDDSALHQAVLAERALLRALRGGCLAPVGAWARLASSTELTLDAVVVGRDGRTRLAARGAGPPHFAADLGQRVAQHLLDQGAAELIAAARDSS
jgi:hydroxymethylbilane synthase